MKFAFFVFFVYCWFDFPNAPRAFFAQGRLSIVECYDIIYFIPSEQFNDRSCQCTYYSFPTLARYQTLLREILSFSDLKFSHIMTLRHFCLLMLDNSTFDPAFTYSRATRLYKSSLSRHSGSVVGSHSLFCWWYNVPKSFFSYSELNNKAGP